MSATGKAPFTLAQRASGLLVHVTSLPGGQGIGDLGPSARAFVAFLAQAGQRWWQMLPVNPTGMGHSPYSGASVFAGNPLLISLEDLAADGLLRARDLPRIPSGERVDYRAVTASHEAALRRASHAFERRGSEAREALADFRARTAFWLPDYALFMALRHARPDVPWTSFDRALARHDAAAIATLRRELADEVRFYEVEQLFFERQWRALRAYAAEHGVGLIGDAPIFVAHDSADVWGNQQAFRLDVHGRPTHVSGVPPDYFSETGQRWGTPLYDWPRLAQGGYRFWVERVRTLMERFDVIRLDHFIGFARYWEIPAHEATAVAGQWVEGPGSALFDTLSRELGSLPFIAEDLGSVTDEVRALRDRHGLPGMRVLQFAFAEDDAASEHLPHNHVQRAVAYTGTHDNDTLVGWFYDQGGDASPRTRAQAEAERARVIRYLGGPSAEALHGELRWEMLRLLLSSVANTAIVPAQDVLGLDGSARMNTPGRAEGNWAFRLREGALDEELAATLRSYTSLYGREPREPTQADASAEERERAPARASRASPASRGADRSPPRTPAADPPDGRSR